MDYEEYNDTCPQCHESWEGYECENCGFCDNLLKDEYETPEGSIVFCTQEVALERGYIATCKCGNTITWWEKEDHGKCIQCWHIANKGLTKKV